jgi:hypothetical protein
LPVNVAAPKAATVNVASSKSASLGTAGAVDRTISSCTELSGRPKIVPSSP